MSVYNTANSDLVYDVQSPFYKKVQEGVAAHKVYDIVLDERNRQNTETFTQSDRLHQLEYENDIYLRPTYHNDIQDARYSQLWVPKYSNVYDNHSLHNDKDHVKDVDGTNAYYNQV